MGFYCPIEFMDNLRAIEPRFPKNLRTNEARSDFTGPYEKKKCMPVSVSLCQFVFVNMCMLVYLSQSVSIALSLSICLSLEF